LSVQEADLKKESRMPLSRFVYLRALSHHGSKEIACGELRSMLSDLVRIRAAVPMVHLYLQFLDDTFSCEQLSFFFYLRGAIKSTPFGIDYPPGFGWTEDSTSRKMLPDADVICSFRACLVARGLVRIFR
jgi:hypothetical protein